MIFVGEFENDVSHSHLGLICRGTISYEYYWLDRWYNVFRFHEPDGNFRNYYCNINMPPTYQNNVLDYVDLDIDVLVRDDLSLKMLDEDEYRRNSEVFNYPDELKASVERSLEELLNLIRNREFPFNYRQFD